VRAKYEMAISEVTPTDPSIAVERSVGTTASRGRGFKSLVAPVTAKLKASPPVRVLHADGQESMWVDGRRVRSAGSAAKFVAVEVPEDLLLRRVAIFPRISDADLFNAVRLDVESHSPFSADDLTWGFSVLSEGDARREVEAVLASRKQIAAFLDASSHGKAARGQVPEVWAFGGDRSVPIVLTGYGESRRLAYDAVRQRWSWVLLALACVLGALLLATPTAKLRFQALEAVGEMDSLTKSTSALMRKRDELTRLDEKLRALESTVAGRVDPLGAIEYLTQKLPDDSYLISVDIQKTKITATGHTNDSAALLQMLSSDPRLKDVRSPTAVTRAPGATKEAFTVEFVMNPPAVVPSTAAASAASPALAAASGPQSTAVATAPQVAVPGTPQVAPKATASSPAASPFAIGGSR
jgi:general secretion pathway protein L